MLQVFVKAQQHLFEKCVQRVGRCAKVKDARLLAWYGRKPYLLWINKKVRFMNTKTAAFLLI